MLLRALQKVQSVSGLVMRENNFLQEYSSPAQTGSNLIFLSSRSYLITLFPIDKCVH